MLFKGQVLILQSDNKRAPDAHIQYMIYPDNFERKIGFSDIRTLLRGRCISSLGTDWVDNKLKFMTDHNEVSEALEQAREFSRFMDEEEDIYEENFFDVRRALLHIRPERTFMEETDLFDLKRSLHTIYSIVCFLQKQPEEGADNMPDGENAKYPALWRMTAEVKTFPDIVKRIDAVLNRYGKVKDTASPELLSVRHQLEVTMRGISHSLRSIIAEAQSEGYIDRDVSPTLRDGRLVIPVAPALKRRIKGIIHDESATGKTVFIEPSAVVEANNKIRELKAAERREIIRILQELTSMIRPHIGEMLESLQFLAHIDYLRALTIFGRNFDCTVPTVLARPCIDWVQAVHPLLKQSLERHGEKVVALDVTLQGKERILLISGPNAGGKSVCLKTVGLLQYMLQCGMPVPMRENSKTGIFRHLFIDIGDEQSLENDLSTYSSHLLNMKEMMKHSDEHSLLLIDEFGGGTEPQIGGAMAEAILDRFVQKGTFGIITTHYQNLKHYAESCPSVINGAMLYDRAQMQPLFILQIGNPGSSFAVEIARKIGIPEEVIAYASELVGKDYILSDKYLQDIVRDKMYWENKRKNIHRREKQLEETVAHYEEEMRTFQQQRKSVLAQAKEEAQQMIQASNAKIENTIRAIREAQAEKERTQEARRELSVFSEQLKEQQEKEDQFARKIAKIKRRQERKKNRKPSTEIEQENRAEKETKAPDASGSATNLKPGNYVRLKGQTGTGRIDSIQGKNARVLFGSFFTSVKLERLEAAEAPKEDKVSKVSTFVSKETRDAMYEKRLHFRPEIDIRGMRANEALNAISYFIDDAIQLEYPMVRILHGTGTGALRELVRNYLETVSGVRNYHDEHVQFGGAGITIAEFD